MRTSESIKELAAALATAQGDMTGIEKDGTNPAFKRDNVVLRYATLVSVWDTIRDPLSKNGLSILQSPGETDGVIIKMTTLLMHKSGEFIEDVFTLPAVGNTPQQVGSAITYARRYTLMAICGIAPEDDDGNAASTHQTKQSAPTVRTQVHKDQPINEVAQENIAPIKASKQQLQDIQEFCDTYNFTVPKNLSILTSYEADQAMVRLEAALAKRLEENKKVLAGATA